MQSHPSLLKTQGLEDRTVAVEVVAEVLLVVTSAKYVQVTGQCIGCVRKGAYGISMQPESEFL